MPYGVSSSLLKLLGREFFQKFKNNSVISNLRSGPLVCSYSFTQNSKTMKLTIILFCLFFAAIAYYLFFLYWNACIAFVKFVIKGLVFIWIVLFIAALLLDPDKVPVLLNGLLQVLCLMARATTYLLEEFLRYASHTI